MPENQSGLILLVFLGYPDPVLPLGQGRNASAWQSLPQIPFLAWDASHLYSLKGWAFRDGTAQWWPFSGAGILFVPWWVCGAADPADSLEGEGINSAILWSLGCEFGSHSEMRLAQTAAVTAHPLPVSTAALPWLSTALWKKLRIHLSQGIKFTIPSPCLQLQTFPQRGVNWFPFLWNRARRRLNKS